MAQVPLPTRDHPALTPQYRDVLVAVKNKGPITVEWDYDRKPYLYEIGKITHVPYEVAMHHWGVQIVNGRLVRPKADDPNTGAQSLYHNRLASLEPKGFMDIPGNKYANPEEFQRFRAWYDKGVEFGIAKGATGEVSEDSFAKMQRVS